MVLALPIAALVSGSYVLVVSFLAPLWASIRRTILASSFLVLVAGSLEFLIIRKWGLLGARGHFGVAFDILHELVCFLTPMALANVLLLVKRKPSRNWLVLSLVALGTFVVAVVLVSWNIEVSETLHGVDGGGGPFAN
ncbi:MAG: hypothetical protein QOK37_3112 [Thermoanaerobaculia bacterium]|nr:hypothetical protein [Thermoanaerobaculia bacterium]